MQGVPRFHHEFVVRFVSIVQQSLPDAPQMNFVAVPLCVIQKLQKLNEVGPAPAV